MVKRITKLTVEQTAAMILHRDKWIGIGLSTAPADRARAEAAYRQCYRSAGLRYDLPIVWVDSPMVGALAAPFAAQYVSIIRAIPDIFRAVTAALKKGGDNAVDSAVDSAVESAVRSAVDSAVGSAVGSAVHSAVHSAVDSAVRSAVHSAVRSAVGSAVDSAVHSAVHSAVGSAVGSAVDSRIKPFWHYWIGGSLWCWWTSFETFFREECSLELSPELTAAAEAYSETTQSAGYWWPNRDFIIACDRPSAINRDKSGRLHNEKAAAISWRDGWGIYLVHGVRVPDWVIESPEKITIENIEGQTNTEIKRVMIEKFGWDRYAAECGAQIIDHDEKYGTLFGRNGAAEFLRVVNGSPEPDGSFRNYILPVAPGCEPLPDMGGDLGDPQELTALNAVASTYGLTGKEYEHVMEVRT